MAAGTIAAAVITASTTALSAASAMGQEAAQKAKGNLSFSVDLINGTEYELIPVWSGFRRGALLGGTEGEFALAPRPIDPRGAVSIACTQVLGATTDVIGAVLYQSELFYWLIGFHAYDQAGIHRYIYSGIFPRKEVDFSAINVRELKLWSGDAELATKLDFWPNKLIWSGAGSGKSTESSNGVAVGRGLKVVGEFKRGLIEVDPTGKVTLNDEGMPVIAHTKVSGDGSEIEFSSQGNGGASEMSAIVFDGPDLYTGDAGDEARVATMTVS